MKRVKIRATGPLSLEMSLRGGKNERLAIVDPFYPNTKLSRGIFRGLGTMQLVAPYLPEIIDTDFEIDIKVAELIRRMYRSCGKAYPAITKKVPQNKWELWHPGSRRAIVSYSAGKDSLHSMLRAQDTWGDENVMAVHIGGLNTANASGERRFAFRQAEKLGFPHFRIVELKSSARCTKNGFQVMRSRDFFMTGILVPVALQFGASDIITEGFEEANEDEPFTGQERNMRDFNDVLKSMGIPVQVRWFNLPEMYVIREVYEQRPGWMPEVHNCFSIACRKDQRRRSWARRTPSWPLYDSQCGSCVKCRITRLGQLMYSRACARSVKNDEVRVFLKDTARYTVNEWRQWHAGNFSKRDMLNGSFFRELRKALEQYGLADVGQRMVEQIRSYERPAKTA
jgi:hypothetical protein